MVRGSVKHPTLFIFRAKYRIENVYTNTRYVYLDRNLCVILAVICLLYRCRLINHNRSEMCAGASYSLRYYSLVTSTHLQIELIITFNFKHVFLGQKCRDALSLDRVEKSF